MSEKYTLGPFDACEPGDYGDYDGRSIVILGDDKRIAVVLNDDEEARANAALFKAAPELLAVARQAESWISQQMLERGWPQDRIDAPPSGSHLFNLRAAIAKATGADA